METNTSKLTREERENVLLVLNEFSESYNENTKAVGELVSSIKECTRQTNMLLQKTSTESPSALFAGEIEKIKQLIGALPEKQLQQLSQKLDKNLQLLQHPLPQKVVHHHRASKFIWISAGLFLLLSLVCCGWLMTGNKLKQYRAADTKYRYLKLVSDEHMQESLDKTDSLYQAGYQMKDSVEHWEAELQKAARLGSSLRKGTDKNTRIKKELERLHRQDKARRKN